MMVAKDAPRLEALSGLRFLSIVYIIVYHLGDASFEGLPPWVDRMRLHASAIMPMFFVLGGFVLTFRYGELLRTGALGMRRFWLSRALRIWPIYLAALALRVAVDVYVNRGVPLQHFAGTISQALLLQGWTPPLVWFGNMPGWTISVDAFLYLLFPWLVWRLYRMPPSHAAAVAGLAWFAGQLVVYFYVTIRPDGWPPAPGPASLFYNLLRYLPPCHLPSFIVGIVAARFFQADRERGEKRGGGWIALTGFVLVTFVLAGGVEFVGRWVPFLTFASPYEHNGLLSPAWALVVFGLSRSGPSLRWLGSRPFVRLGNASYGLYILHFPVFDAVSIFVVPDWDRTRFFLVQLFAVLLPLAVISFERVEQPLRVALFARATRAERRDGVQSAAE